jgi:hypothetical protein
VPAFDILMSLKIPADIADKGKLEKMRFLKHLTFVGAKKHLIRRKN